MQGAFEEPMVRRLASRAVLAFVLGACGSARGPDALDVGGDDAGGGAFVSGDAKAPAALDAYVEESGIRITFVRVACAGDCATVQAIPTGGNAPYTFVWDDGSASATRRVCPLANTSYFVRVSDTGTTGEFARPSQTVQVPLGAEVLACADAGPSGPCDSLAASFSPGGANPAGPWSYGSESTVGAAFAVYPTFVAADLDAGALSGQGFPAVAQWFDVSLGQVGTTGPVPDIQFNPSAMPVYPGNGNFTGNSWIVEPGQVVMATPTVGTSASVARWTAASAGTFPIHATFASAANAPFTQTADVHVQRNGVDLAAGAGSITMTSTSFSFSASVGVSAGDRVDFVVAPGSSPIYHAIALDAEVCASST
jgi:hypothetical protein